MTQEQKQTALSILNEVVNKAFAAGLIHDTKTAANVCNSLAIFQALVNQPQQTEKTLQPA